MVGEGEGDVPPLLGELDEGVGELGIPGIVRGNDGFVAPSIEFD